MTNKITGTVQKYNKTGDKPAGILINGSWYNGTDKTEKYLTKELVGYEVELDINEKRQIEYIKQLSETKSPQKQENDQYTHPQFIGVALKIANERIVSKESSQTMTPREWAVSVLIHTEELIAIAKERKLYG